MAKKPTYEELERRVKDLDKKSEGGEFKQLWSTYSQSPIPTLILSRGGGITDYNDAMAELTGFVHEEVPDIDVWMPKIYPDEEYRNKVSKVSEKSRYRKIDVKRDEFIIATKAGEKRHVEFSVFDILHEGKPTDMQVVQGVDITEKAQMREELQRSHVRLEQQVKERTTELSIANEKLKHEIKAHEKAEEALGESENCYAKAERIGNFGHYDQDLLENKGTWSNETYRIFGVNPDQFQPTWENFLNCIHPSDRESLKSKVETAASQGKGFDHDYRIIRSDGSERFIHSIAEVDFNESGQPTGLTGTVLDVTEQKQTEEVLRLHTAMMDNVAEGVYLIGLDDLLIKWTNEKFARMFGYEPGEMVGKHVDIVNAPTERTPTKTRISIVDVLEETGEWHGEVRNIKRDGTHFWCSANVSLFDHPEYGKVLVSVHTDITDRKKAEEALRESEEKYRSMMEAMNDATYICSPDFRVEYMNPAMIERIGHDATGETCYKTLYDRDEKCPWCIHEKIMRGESTQYELTSPKDAHIHDISSSPIHHSDGSISQLTIFHDITERKQAEEALRLQSQIAANMSEGVYLIRARDGVIVYTNPKFEEIFGYGPGEMTGKHVSVLNAPTDKSPEEVAKEITEFINKHGFWRGEVNNIKKDGTPFWCYASVSVFDHPEYGEVWVVIHYDITERKQAEEALRESEDLFRQMFEQSKTSTQFFDTEGTCIKVNPKFCELFGVEAEVITDGRYNMFEDQATMDAGILDLIRETFDKKKTNRWQIPFDISSASDSTGTPTTRQETVWIDVLGYPILDKNGKLQYVIHQHVDITESKNAEEARQMSEATLNAILSSAQDAIYMLDFNSGERRYVNPAMADMTGYSTEELMSMGFQDTVDPETVAMFRDIARKMIVERKAVRGIEYEIIRKDGSRITVSSTIAPLIAEDKIASIVGVMRDISERKQAEEERSRLESQLQQAQKMEAIGTLAGGIAHDFNNVLYSIIGYTELTMDDVPEGSLAQKNLKGVLNGALRARDMILQILAFSRKADTVKKPIKVQSVVAEALKFLRTSIPTTIEIRQNIDADCGPILADSTQIHQVVMNLATNAYQEMREKGGVLELTLMEEQIRSDDSSQDLHSGTYLKLTVSDTGLGINEAVIEKIFDPYFTTKGPGEGTGMGLAVVHGIVKDHGGDIKVHSKLGEGTTFSVYLPMVKSRPVEQKTIATELVATGTERILFVDDEEALAFMTQQTLERLGYQVTSRTSSVEALEAFKAKPDEYDLVITDMTMPNMTGVELSARLREIRPDIPIILCTGFSEMIDEDKAKSMGISAYIMKPILKDEIGGAIRKVLDKVN